jgi:multicomponent Na+:H+ antiporter subunit D
MRLAMVFFAFLCIAIGIWPAALYAILPFPVDYVPYTLTHVVEMLQLLLFSGLAFFIMLPYMKRTLTITLDWDWLYRRLGPRAVSQMTQVLSGNTDWHAVPVSRTPGNPGPHLGHRQHGPLGSHPARDLSGCLLLLSKRDQR